jgi:hypothetical protein
MRYANIILGQGILGENFDGCVQALSNEIPALSTRDELLAIPEV